MLDIKRVLLSAKSHPHEQGRPLATPWGATLDAEHVLAEHPRPTMERAGYTMLNGTWELAITPVPGDAGASRTVALTAEAALHLMRTVERPRTYDRTILVPFSPETVRSGVGHILQPDELLWYRRRVTLPAPAEGRRLILHFEAVDWVATVWLGGAVVGSHVGGYTPFACDITEQVRAATGPLDLVVCVYDPTDAGVQPRGKQRLDAGGIWYTPQSGIWQSVWTEEVGGAWIERLTLNGQADGALSIDAAIADPAHLLGPDAQVALTLADGDEHSAFALPLGATEMGGARALHATVTVPHPHLWSPDDPHLMPAQVALLDDAGTTVDELASYCAFRTVAVAPDASGTMRFMLNGAPLFLKGALDQGYWSDTLMTAPADAAIVHDIEAARAAGFNMLRKHIKIEPERWYYHCDRLGMLVWQDAVSGGSPYSLWHTSRKPTLFQASWGAFADDTPRHRRALSAGDAAFRQEWEETCDAMVRRLMGHPCVVTWVLFNEGWGQFDAAREAERVHALDPTRPIDATSGWYDQGAGDFLSHHNYFRPLAVFRDAKRLCGYAAARGGRAFIISEFGGWTWFVASHSEGERGYGYGGFETLAAWRDAAAGSLAEAGALEAQGLAGYVYTQLSDVEDELNGILTFDRRVNKLVY